MKKFVFSLVALGFLGSIGLGVFVYINKGSEIFTTPANYLGLSKAINESSTSLIDEDVAAIQDILNQSVESDLDLSDLTNLSDSEIADLTTTSSDSSESGTKKRMVPKIFTTQKFFENAFIKFTHPGYIEILNGSISFIEVKSKEELIGTINIYSNPEKLSLEEFVKRDNLVDYFAEANKLGIPAEDFAIPTSTKAVKFTEYPGTKVSDIFLVEFDGLVVVAVDFSEDKVVGEYILRSMEKTR
jgi:hypothetical protein